MSSTTSRGNAYKKKSQEYYQSLGYVTQLTEFTTARFVGPGKVIYVKKDVFGADGISMNGHEIIFWNSKHSTVPGMQQKYFAECRKEFHRFPFPKFVKLQMIYWEPRKKPIIINID